jgi:hypothetical protein
LEESSLNLDLKNDDDIVVADIIYQEIHTRVLDKENLPCKRYGVESNNDYLGFVNCCKEALWSKIQYKLNCSVFYLDQFHGGITNLTSCNSKQMAKSTISLMAEHLVNMSVNTQLFGCPLPCFRISYSLDVNYYHENTVGANYLFENVPASNFTVYFFFRSPWIEERIETLTYDLGGMLAAAGGNLGLMLGFSCLTLVFGIINWVKKNCRGNKLQDLQLNQLKISP